jgi:hypothetical protein
VTGQVLHVFQSTVALHPTQGALPPHVRRRSSLSRHCSNWSSGAVITIRFKEVSHARTHISNIPPPAHESVKPGQTDPTPLGPPVGYVRSPDGGYELDPDEQARLSVRMVFDQFYRLGTVRKVLRHLLAQGIRLGIRPHTGPNRGQLEWRLPTRDTVTKILAHPIYAGYYTDRN